MGLLVSQDIIFPEEIYITLCSLLSLNDLFATSATNKWPPEVLDVDRFWTRKSKREFGPRISQFSSKKTPEGIYRQIFNLFNTLPHSDRLIWAQRTGHSEFVIKALQRMKEFEDIKMTDWSAYTEGFRVKKPGPDSLSTLLELLSIVVCQGDIPVLNQLLQTVATWRMVLCLESFADFSKPYYFNCSLLLEVSSALSVSLLCKQNGCFDQLMFSLRDCFILHEVVRSLAS